MYDNVNDLEKQSNYLRRTIYVELIRVNGICFKKKTKMPCKKMKILENN